MNAVKLTYGDRIYSRVHGKFVRFVRMTDGEFAEVMDSNTLAMLPDLVYRVSLGANWPARFPKPQLPTPGDP